MWRFWMVFDHWYFEAIQIGKKYYENEWNNKRNQNSSTKAILFSFKRKAKNLAFAEGQKLVSSENQRLRCTSLQL